jgi:hypothetical protein
MKITKPTIRLSKEELSILERAKDICNDICENCPELGNPWGELPVEAENANYCLASLLDLYNDHVNEEC